MHHDFDHVLRTLLDGVAIGEDRTETLEDRCKTSCMNDPNFVHTVSSLRRHFRQHLAALFEERDRHLDGVVRGLLHEQDEHLEDEDLVRHALIGQVPDELRHRDAGGLVVAPEGPLELNDQSAQDELADVGELGVDDGDERRVDVREGRREGLRLDDRACQQASELAEISWR